MTVLRIAALGLAAVVATAQPPSAIYVPPVTAPVVDPFRPPVSRYGAGNRGLEYGTAEGQTARAAASGVVAFAGTIGPYGYVSIDHPDGLRTTYSFLASIAVSRGEQVAQGTPIGTTTARLHFGARVGDVYLDPAVLFGGTQRRARLVPIEGGVRRVH